ncbi:hypothetical protein L6R53_14190 [Myxococcota bacterium]|nr:hypothetical protein [Myxococcota bacterium]
MAHLLDLPDLLPPLAPGEVPTDPGRLLPRPEPLVDALIAARPGPGLEPILGELGCPTVDLLATPAAARAGLLAARVGRAFTHHELRVRLPMPEGLEPEVAVWAGGTVPAWRDGVLEEPKYFSFFQDDPHSPFNPNHRAKWRSHELLHGVAGWCWHPGLTRFELYLGGRLAELVPIIHWYGLDELLRPRCARHADQPPTRELCRDCEAAGQRPFWEVDRAALREEALRTAAGAAEHLATEWAACLHELERGERVRTPRPGLDASSDAEGYLLGHWNRLTAWSFGAWVERFCVAGVDHEPDPAALAARVARTCHDLCSGAIEVDLSTLRRLRARKALQDLGYRALLLLEHAGEGPGEDALLPEIDALAEVAERLRHGGGPEEATRAMGRLLAASDAAAAHLPGELLGALGALGTRWLSAEAQVDAGLDQVLEGLADALPDSWAAMREPEDTAWRFVASPAFDRAGSLGRRFAAWWEEEGGADADLVALEALVRDLPRRDDEAELFAVVPEAPVEPGEGVCRWNHTLRRSWLAADVLDPEDLEGCDRWDEQGRVEVAVAWLSGEPRVLVLDQALADALEAVAEGRAADPASWSRLVDAGLVVTWPAPRYARA